MCHDNMRIMKRVYTKPLPDQELRRQLETKDIVLFVGPSLKWQAVERQVERLGFGDSYIVSCTKRPNATASKILLKPYAQAAQRDLSS
jgi:hypothetical protein